MKALQVLLLLLLSGLCACKKGAYSIVKIEDYALSNGRVYMLFSVENGDNREQLGAAGNALTVLNKKLFLGYHDLGAMSKDWSLTAVFNFPKSELSGSNCSLLGTNGFVYQIQNDEFKYVKFGPKGRFSRRKLKPKKF